MKQKNGVNMKKSILIGIMLISILIIAGCTTNDQSISSSISLSNTKTICGNGIAEKGETADNCCVDVSCSDGFECKEKIENEDTIYFCKKLSKTERYEYQKFLEYNDQIDLEYDKTETILINWDSMFSKIEYMKGYLSNLKAAGYDVSVDEEYLKHYERRIKLNKQVYAIVSETDDSLSDSEKKANLDEIISLQTAEIKILSAIEPSMKIELDRQYQYDINGKIESANEYITNLQALKEMINKGLSATIDVTSFDSSCYSGEGYLTSVNIGIKNNGGFTIYDPKIDVFLMDGTKQVDKDTDNYFGYDDLNPEAERFEQITFMLGYVNGESSTCKKYDLKINLRSGADPKIIATTTVKVEIK